MPDKELFKVFLARMTSNLKLLNKILRQKKSESKGKSSVAEQRKTFTRNAYLATMKVDVEEETFVADLIEVLKTVKKDLHLLK